MIFCAREKEKILKLFSFQFPFEPASRVQLWRHRTTGSRRMEKLKLKFSAHISRKIIKFRNENSSHFYLSFSSYFRFAVVFPFRTRRHNEIVEIMIRRWMWEDKNRKDENFFQFSIISRVLACLPVFLCRTQFEHRYHVCFKLSRASLFAESGKLFFSFFYFTSFQLLLFSYIT